MQSEMIKTITSIIEIIDINVSQDNAGQQNNFSDSKNHSSLAFESSNPFFLILSGQKNFRSSSP
jgi:hypothetical protein